ALATSLSTVRSILPHRSGTQLAAVDRLKKFEMLPVLAPETPGDPTRPPLLRVRVACSLNDAVGKKPARACAVIASASRKAAAADFKFWFEMSICRSRPSRTGSW